MGEGACLAARRRRDVTGCPKCAGCGGPRRGARKWGGGVCWLGGRELGARWVASQEAESTTSDFKGRCLDTHFCPLPPPPRR